jgi:hypothetical protein
MSITTILLTLLLSGFGNSNPHPNGVFGVGASQPSAGVGGVSVNEVYGGGPSGSPNP